MHVARWEMLRWLPITLVFASAWQFGALVYGLKLIDYWVMKMMNTLGAVSLNNQYLGRTTMCCSGYSFSPLPGKIRPSTSIFANKLGTNRLLDCPSQMLLMRHIKELYTAFACQSWLKDNFASDNWDSRKLQAIGRPGLEWAFLALADSP